MSECQVLLFLTGSQQDVQHPAAPVFQLIFMQKCSILHCFTLCSDFQECNPNIQCRLAGHSLYLVVLNWCRKNNYCSYKCTGQDEAYLSVLFTIGIIVKGTGPPYALDINVCGSDMLRNSTHKMYRNPYTVEALQITMWDVMPQIMKNKLQNL